MAYSLDNNLLGKLFNLFVQIKMFTNSNAYRKVVVGIQNILTHLPSIFFIISLVFVITVKKLLH